MRVVDTWLRGDAEALLAWLDELGTQPLWAVERMRWELSTALGTVAEAPHVSQGDRPLTQSLTFDAPLVTGGAPRRLVDADQTVHAWSMRAREALSRDHHREAMSATLDALLAGQHPAPDDAFALLRHHTDSPVDFMAGRPLLGSPFGTLRADELDAELQPLTAVLSDAAAFDAHVQAGLSSSSLPRRDLSWRLQRLPSSLGG